MFTVICLCLMGLCLFKTDVPATVGLLAMAIAIFEKGEDGEDNEE